MTCGKMAASIYSLFYALLNLDSVPLREVDQWVLAHAPRNGFPGVRRQIFGPVFRAKPAFDSLK